MSGYWPAQDQPVSAFNQSFSEGPPTGIAENYAADQSTSVLLKSVTSRDIGLGEAYGDRIDEIYKTTGQKLDNPVYSGEEDAVLNNGMLSDTTVNQHIADFESKADVLRQQYPSLTTPETMWQNLKYNIGSSLAENASVDDRATTLGKLGGLAGGTVGFFENPANLLTLPFAAARGLGILRTAVTEGLFGAGTQAISESSVQRWQKELGLESGLVPALKDIGEAGIQRGVMGGGIRALHIGLETPVGQKITGAVSDATSAIQNMTGKKLVSLFDKTVPNPTPEQSLARDMQAHINDVNDTSPLDPATPGAIEEHNMRLTESINALQNDTTPDMPETPAAPISQDTLDAVPGQLDGLMQTFNPADIQTDAKTFQFKEGGDASGVTDRLQGVQQWDPVKGGMVIVYENNDGAQFIADGHQRLGLAQRIQAQSPDAPIKLYGPLFRESDGYTPETVRVIAAMKNIAEGTGTAVDAAKVLRVDPARISELPRNSQLVRQAGDMVNLTDNAFSYVINDQVPANQGAIVGRLVKEPGMQDAIIGLLAKVEPENVAQAEAIVRQAIEAGVHIETQQSLFGEEQVTSSLYLERAKVLDKTLKKLRMEGKVFQTLVDNADRIQNEGNILNAATNAARAETDGRAVQMVQTLANRKGLLSDALTAAARRAADEGKFSNATNDFVTAVRSSAERGDFNGLEAGGNGHPAEIAAENKPRSIHPAETPQDEKTLKLFDEPGGQGSRDQARALEADIRREIQNTRGKEQQYHGTSNEITGLQEYTYDSRNIYGQGFYTTDALDIAKGYSKKGGGTSPSIYRVTEKTPQRLFDMEAPLSREALDAVHALKDDYVEQILEADHPTNLRELYDYMREYSEGEGLSRDTVHELFDSIAYNLEQKGYTGLRHIGGLLTGKEPHNVNIYFSPKRDLSLEKATIDKTSQGDQLVIPGAEKKSLQDIADKNAGDKLKPSAEQQGANEGLFDVAGRGQSDLLDQQIPVGEHIDENGNIVSQTKSVRQLLEEMDGDAKDLEAIGKCGMP